MSGQVDEAGREVAGLRTQLAEARAEAEMKERLLKTMDHWAEVAETCEGKSNAYAAENARLAGQVAAIRALHRKVSEAHRFDYDHYCAVCITAPDEGFNETWPCPTIQALDSLVASSPTTPEAKK